jgi:transcriptional regulator with XRE-family HTH domain
MRFGEKLSLLRKRRGMTQLELAEELNVSRQAVSRWEQGISNPSTENMVRIGELLDVSIDTLVNENAQLQTETAVLVVEAEEKKAVERHDKRGILKIAVTVLAAVIVALIVFIGLSREQYVPAQPPGPIDMDDLGKDIIDQDNSNKGVLPLEPVD